MGLTARNPQHSTREFYTNVYPNVSVVHVEKPPCYLRKFIAFSSDQASLEIYRYMGCSAAADLFLDYENRTLILNDGTGFKSFPIRNKIFDTF